jgi:hypothetical protein
MMETVGHAPFHKILSRLYYNISEPTAYTSQKLVYAAAKKIQKSITLADVNKWFSGQPAATVWSQRRQPHRNPYIQACYAPIILRYYYCKYCVRTGKKYILFIFRYVHTISIKWTCWICRDTSNPTINFVTVLWPFA